MDGKHNMDAVRADFAFRLESPHFPAKAGTTNLDVNGYPFSCVMRPVALILPSPPGFGNSMSHASSRIQWQRRFVTRWAITILLLLFLAARSHADSRAQSAGDTIDWLGGPFTASLIDIATIKIPEGFLFADPANAARFLQTQQERLSGTEIAIVRPYREEVDWYIVLEFDAIGYVSEQSTSELDPDTTLQQLREINDEENRQRIEKGWAPARIVQWEQTPTYHPDTHHLQWALRVERNGVTDINVNTRILGRHGIVLVNLVVSPEDAQQATRACNQLIESIQFNTGQRYAEFRSGDKIAHYGLTALITGTAAAAALKAGLMRRLLAPLLLAFAGLIAAARRWLLGHSSNARPPS